jgi:hypothetical protein
MKSNISILLDRAAFAYSNSRHAGSDAFLFG